MTFTDNLPPIRWLNKCVLMIDEFKEWRDIAHEANKELSMLLAQSLTSMMISDPRIQVTSSAGKFLKRMYFDKGSNQWEVCISGKPGVKIYYQGSDFDEAINALANPEQ